MCTGSFLGVKSGRRLTLTPHPLLVPWSWKSRAIPLLPLWAVRPVQSLSACTRAHFTSTCYYSKYLGIEGWCLLDCGALYYGRYLLRVGTKLLLESSVENGNLVYGNWGKLILRGLFPTYQIKRQVPKTLCFLLPSRKVQISHFNAKMCSSVSSNRKFIEGILRCRIYMYVKKKNVCMNKHTTEFGSSSLTFSIKIATESIPSV